MFFVQNTENIASVCQLSSNLQHSSHKESVTGNVTSFPVCYTGWHAELSPLGLVQHMDDGAEMFQTPLVCAEGGYERGDDGGEPSDFSALQTQAHALTVHSPGCNLLKGLV